MRAVLNDGALFKDIDGIGMHNGGQTMGNQYGNLILFGGNVTDSLRNFLFRNGIQRRSSFIKQ